jgi:putative PEP-CTERM system histidine kinase
MITALLLWGHALAGLAFGVLALGQANRDRGDWPRSAAVAALATTSLWALTVAGLEAHDIANPLAVTIRDLSWFVLMGLLVRRDRSAGVALASVYAMAVGMVIASAALALVETASIDAIALAAIANARFACRMMEAIAGLVLVQHLARIEQGPLWLIRPVVLVLGAMWGCDLLAAALGYIGVPPDSLVAVRGFVLTAVAIVFGVAARGNGERPLSLSRSIAMRAIGGFALIIYGVATVMLTALAGLAPLGYVRIAQTGVVFGSATGLMTLLSTPWLRAWSRVMLTKHLFRHRYDYRAEWQRFTTTIGVPGPHADPLDTRIVKAIADLIDSPAGLLLVAHPQGLEAATRWRWEGTGGAESGLSRYLERTQRIIELDNARRALIEAEEAAVLPNWMLAREDAWALVPLIHQATLVGAILLARPPVDRALDWEDLDLLRIVGRQAASYLAEDRAHGALAEARRFDEFNRRFAFILHDIKNLVSGLTLVARNAERHADNPDFRADMIATLQDSVLRMNALLAKLSQHHQSSAEPMQPVAVAALAARIATARRAQHPIVTAGEGIAIAQPGRLEQLLDHLVQNAIEASGPADVVTIRTRASGDRVEIDVVDTGVGMSATFVRDQLFRPFASSKPAGFGIGAYEARQLAETMGGIITVDSREGEGTRFTVSLPAAAAMEIAA